MKPIKTNTNTVYSSSVRYYDRFYDIWSLFDNAALEKISTILDIDRTPSSEDKQRHILYKTILTNLDLFGKFKTEQDMLDMINKIIGSLEKCDIFQYTNAIINIFRVAKLTGDLEKGFEVYEKIKDK